MKVSSDAAVATEAQDESRVVAQLGNEHRPLDTLTTAAAYLAR